jgi:hypothetical protein
LTAAPAPCYRGAMITTKTIFARRLAACALAAAALAAPASARAQESTTPPPAFAPATGAGGGFGGTGQWVLSLGGTNDTFFFLHKQSGGGWQLQILPALDYFITSSVSVGGAVGFRHDSGSGDTPVIIGARAGFNLNISGPVGFWPMAGVFGTHVFHTHGSDNSATLRLFAPFLYHLAPHFFIGGGPSFDLSLTSDGNQYGLDIILGGWI